MQQPDDTLGRTGIVSPVASRSNTAPSSITLDKKPDTGQFLPFQQFSRDLSQNLPASFNFGSQNMSSMSLASDEFHTPEAASPQEERADVFVFSGSSPVLVRKRRNAVTPPPPPPPPPLLSQAGGTEAAKGEGSLVECEQASREVAMLTQQLELESDDVSGEWEGVREGMGGRVGGRENGWE